MTRRKLIDPFGPMVFDYGETLTVLRGATFDEFGDRIGSDSSHTIGPCAMKRTEEKIDTGGDGPRNRLAISVTAPPDSDITETDRVRLPDGKIATLTAAPVRPRNPFTGWQPFVKFTLTVE